jgi:D-alanyl-D-alanine carboxypeptidase
MIRFVAKHARMLFIGVALLIFVAFSLRSTEPYTSVFETTPARHVPEFVGPVTAEEWGIFDPETGALLRTSTEISTRPIASIAKLFSAAVVIKSAVWDTQVIIEHHDVGALGRAGRLTVGDVTTPYELVFPLILESSNDAAAAIERVLGSALYEDLSVLIADAQLENTVIVDASGLSPGNVSTVRDLALFFSYLKHNAPHVLDISQLYRYLTNTAAYQNNNPARMFEAFRGGKHGYTEEAGHTFLGMLSTAVEGREIGIVILGSSDLEADIASLYRFGTELVGSGILETP